MQFTVQAMVSLFEHIFTKQVDNVMYICIQTLLIISDFDVCNVNTRQKYNFHQPPSNLSLYQKRYWHEVFASHNVSKI